MTPIETLRTAAALMRERAASATCRTGPGSFHRCSESTSCRTIALAVADWLDAQAEWLQREPDVIDLDERALTVARAYLGASDGAS
jgi:hypothetical protein